MKTCDACSRYQQDAWALRRTFVVHAVTDEGSTAATQPTVSIAGSLTNVSLLRWALMVIGGTLVILNVQSIVLNNGTAAAHLSRHDGVFGTALGIGMLAVAAKPQRAIGLVPLTSAIAVMMSVVAVVDLVSGDANFLAEAVHVVQFAGLVCLWVISGGPTRFQHRIDWATAQLEARRTATVPEWPNA